MAAIIEDDERYEFCHSALQRKLVRIADRLLAKSGFFEPVEVYEEEYVPWNVENIGVHGLRPSWHGKA